MKTTIELVGIIITLPFLALEAMIKGVMYILYFPLTLCIAIIYPLIKIGHIYLGLGKDLKWVKKWWKYVNSWSLGDFYTAHIYDLWEIIDY